EGAAVYFVHVSAGAGVAAIAEARGEGRAIYGETLHHYATFTADAYLRPDGVMFHTYPSLKYEADRHQLWNGLTDRTLRSVAPGGGADLVGFDHTLRRTLRSAELHGSDYSAWDGWEVHGWPAVVILRGMVAVDNGKLSGSAGDGRRVPGKLAAAIQDGSAV